MLGDDDLVSLALADQAEVTVVELDPELVGFLRDARIVVREHDLMQELPAEFEGAFDVVLTDPPYARKGFQAFLTAAAGALRSGGILLLSTNLGMLEEPRAPGFVDFDVVSHQVAFNRYPFPEDLTVSCVEQAACYDLPPELGALIFGPPLFYSDLWMLRRKG